MVGTSGDNENKRHLEHFIANLAPPEDELWRHANANIEALNKEAFCKFSNIRKQKAFMHTWLAWQKEPGKRFGDAVKAAYLNAKMPAADAFV